LLLTLRLYQAYDWVVRGSQPISRYFTVEGQIGESVIDVAGRRVVVTVPESMGRKEVKVLSAKLGPEGSTMTPDPAGNTYDMTMPLEVKVSVHGREELWEVFCETSLGTVTTVRADAGSQVAWIYGSCLADAAGGVEYRVAGLEQWAQAPRSWITQTGGTFFGRLINLEPETEYEVRAYATAADGAAEYGAVTRFTTGDLRQLPNSSFDQWSKVKKYDVPWPEGGEPFWDTSNPGSTKAGGSGNVFCSSQTSTGSGYSAELQSQFVNLFGFGQFASGSIYTGTFLGVDGMNGILGFGRPFDQRPVKLRGYFKYNMAEINYSNDELKNLIGEPDTCIVWCALTDFNEPMEIRTNPANRSLFDPEAGYTIAYGKMQCGQTVPQFIPFEIELEYKSTQKVPKYIICVAASSKYGDYFTGGTGSTMWVDDLELLYDY
ncbi:MAG: PCMD domain-containing protein, partial [Muribaculaceae bacterium]|nr:PCMD domain-containing protein [Muribaculaceae bacterium]